MPTRERADGQGGRQRGMGTVIRRHAGRTVTGRLLDLIDAVDVVLEVEPTEEEGHDRVELKANGFRSVEVLLQGAALHEASDEANDPDGKADEAADGTGAHVSPRGRNVVPGERDDDGKLNHGQGSSTDVIEERSGIGLHALEPRRNDDVPDPHEDRAGKESEEQHETPMEVGGVGVGGGREAGGICKRIVGGVVGGVGRRGVAGIGEG